MKINKKNPHWWLLIFIASQIWWGGTQEARKSTLQSMSVLVLSDIIMGENHCECGQPHHQWRDQLEYMGERRNLFAQECFRATRRWDALVLCAVCCDVFFLTVGWYILHSAHKHHYLPILFGIQWVSLRLRSSIMTWAVAMWCLGRWSDKAPISHWSSLSLKYRYYLRFLPFSCHSFCYPNAAMIFLNRLEWCMKCLGSPGKCHNGFYNMGKFYI